MKSTEENRRTRTVFQSFIERQEDGAMLDYFAIEQATGVRMDQRGRRLFKAAVRACDRVVETVRGKGVRLSSKDNALTIVASGVQSIGNAVRRTHKTHALLSKRHLLAMEKEDQNRMIVVGSVLGAIAGSVTNAREALPERELPKPNPLALVAK